MSVSCLSAFRSRVVEARSTRKLCKAVNMYEVASATAPIRLTAPSRCHDVQAPAASATMMIVIKDAMTDLRMKLTERRLSIACPRLRRVQQYRYVRKGQVTLR